MIPFFLKILINFILTQQLAVNVKAQRTLNKISFSGKSLMEINFKFGPENALTYLYTLNKHDVGVFFLLMYPNKSCVQTNLKS